MLHPNVSGQQEGFPMRLLNSPHANSCGVAYAAQGDRIGIGPETASGATLVLEVPRR
jgi:hypothetical protein